MRESWLLPVLEQLVPDRTSLAGLPSDTLSLWAAAVDARLARDPDIVAAVAKKFRAKVAELTTSSAEARDVVPESLARKHRFVPLALTASTIDVAVFDPNDLDCEDAVGFATGRSVRMLIASPSQIAARLDEIYQPEKAMDTLLESVGEHDVRSVEEDDGAFDLGAEKASERPIIKLVDHILAEGITQRASDLHLESAEDGVKVIYRIDGVLRHSSTLPRALGIPLVSRIKIMSGLDIADRLRPQDGRARVQVDGRRVDLRVSTLPASTGEKVVVRILDRSSNVLALDSLGLSESDFNRIQQLVNLREGIVLVTGPTGSGKTTTLYSSLKTIQTRGVNIVTVEDPVEYKLAGVVQVQVNEKAGLTFAAALRSILRQDPDVVLVGEIRDLETARIAIQASLTGHLVLSTLHTIDAASSVARLLDIGIESYKIGAALKGVIAQRLVRRLCSHCKEPLAVAPSARFRRWIPEHTVLYRSAGCDKCGQTGYLGRLALLEVLVTDANLERRIAAGETAEKITEAAREAGMCSLWDSGIGHVISGTTDLEELMRVLEVPIAEPRRTPEPVRRTSVSTSGSHGAQSSLDTRRLTPRGVSANLTGNAAFELVDDVRNSNDGGAHRVLIVEDDEGDRRIMRDCLSAAGFAIGEARDGIEALEEIDHSAPDAVLVNVSLPLLGGLGVLARLRSRLPTAGLPVVIVADGVDEDLEVEAFKDGANDFIVKPIRPNALAARIKAMLSRVTV
jgi:type II secretory ATPase GspE/PulE/Tfp pilus assembly ATPase PilB-like protein/ActR/RegA family two-component response regulator